MRDGSAHSGRSYLNSHNWSVRSGNRFSLGDRTLNPGPGSGGGDPDRSRRGRWLTQGIMSGVAGSKDGSVKSRWVHLPMVGFTVLCSWR